MATKKAALFPATAALGAGKATGGYAPPAAPVPHKHVTRMLGADGEESPRLIPADDSVMVGAPLLPEPEDNAPEERFCVDGPVIATPGMPARRSAAAVVTVVPFSTLVTRMETSVGQAALLLNDRLRTLSLRATNTVLSGENLHELCEVADGVTAAAYHVQKWAALLAPAEENLRKPSKPGNCEEQAEAFAAMHCASPRILVAAAGANKGFLKAIKDHGEKAEASVNRTGIPTEDIRALGPHLEAVLHRLSRLSSKVRDPLKKLPASGYGVAPADDQNPFVLPSYLEESGKLDMTNA